MEGDTHNLYAIAVRVDALSEKVDAVHLSLEKDLSEVKGQLLADGKRLSNTELKLARLQGAGAALTLGLPFVALALEKVIH